ncbi:MAG: anti-sigma regulatory factor (Ser/Thr protein kinase) [Cellvibrionaceae bacterium]|jgi:anti-sigma regulatory factor (Ser/Thr protein kinase)
MMQKSSKTDDSLFLNVKARFTDLPILDEFIPTALRQLLATEQEIDVETLSGELILAIHEVCVNMIDHAYKAEGDNPITVSLTIDSTQREVVVEVVDQGDSYNPKQLEWPPPHCWQILEEGNGQSFVLGQVPEPDLEAERGRGVYLLTGLLDFVKYYSRAGRNYWVLKKSYV